VSNAITEAVLIASAGMLSIGQILLMLLLLSSAGGFKKAVAYAAGMTGVLGAIGASALLLGTSRLAAGEGPEGPGLAAWGSLGLGVLLLFMAVRVWRTEPTAEAAVPKFMRSLDDAGPGRLLALGAVVGGANVKNLAIYLAAVDVLVRARPTAAQGLGALAVVTAVFCLYLLVPLGIYLLGGRRAEPVLAALRRALEKHHRPLSLGVLVVFGIAFGARGVHLLAG